MISAAIAQR